MAKETTYKKRGEDYEVSAEMLTLPGKYYHSEAIYREEVEKIFSRRWSMVCREEEIPGVGDYLVVPVGDESVIVVRSSEEEIRAFFNVCRHRGTRICGDAGGRFESGCIQCPYHAWTYELSGRLQAAPLMKDQPGFDPDAHHLFPAHVGRWGGFVFLNIADDPAPFEQEMAHLVGKFEAWRMEDLRIARVLEYTLECNWKIILQNYQECYHCPGVHPLLSKWTPFRSAVHDCFDGSVIGGYMELSKERGSMTMDGEAAGPPVCDVAGDDLQRIYYYSVFPNLLLSPHPDFVLYHRIRSLGVGRIRNDCHFLLHPDVIADEKAMARFESAVEFWDLTNRQDWQVCEQMQQGTRSRRFTRGRYAQQEDILYALDREVLKALGHPEPE